MSDTDQDKPMDEKSAEMLKVENLIRAKDKAKAGDAKEPPSVQKPD